MAKMIMKKDLDEQFGFAGIALKKPLVKVTDNFYINIYETQSVWFGKHKQMDAEMIKITFKNGETEILLINEEITKDELEKFVKEYLI